MWVNPMGIANVVSMKSLTNRYHVRFDSQDHGGYFRVKTERGILRFLPHSIGLYYINLTKGENAKVLFVITILKVSHLKKWKAPERLGSCRI